MEGLTQTHVQTKTLNHPLHLPTSGDIGANGKRKKREDNFSLGTRMDLVKTTRAAE